LNVLHIISSKTWRGAEQQVAYIMNGSFTGITMYLLCPEKSALAEEMNQQVFTYRKRFGFDIAAALRLKNICRAQLIDIIHLHDSQSINTYFIASLFGLSLPCVVHRHVNFPIRSTWKYKFKNLKKIICVSREVKRNLLSIISVADIVVIPSGIDLKKYSSAHNCTTCSLKNQFSIPAEHQLVGIVTSFEKEKNVEEFIAVALALVQENNTVHFIIAGDGSLKSSLTVQHPQIHYTGFRTDIPELLAQLDVFLFTSENEGLGIAVLEAMAAKVPVVCRNFAAANEYLTDNVSGYLYKDTDDAVYKVSKLLNDGALKKRLREMHLKPYRILM
jgi:L-malate glycosyltransferase